MHATLERIRNTGLVPVLKLATPDQAIGLGRALMEGGVPVAEVTFRTDAAAESIRRMRAELPGLLTGAGTVLSPRQAAEAAKAGAEFLVAPALNPEVVRAAADLGLPILPGVSGPDGVDAALALGLDAVKLFPAEAAGGLRMLDALAGPYADMNFVPTGGIDASNAGDYLKRGNVLAVGGSWMAPAALIEAGDWASISSLCAAAALAVHGFSLGHVGINGASEDEARSRVALLAALFGFRFKEAAASFIGDGMELTKSPFPGSPGHLGIRANDLRRALDWLGKRGVKPVPGTERIERGTLKAVYLDLDFAGMAVHLML